MTQKTKNIQPTHTLEPVMLVTGSAKRIGAAIIRAAHKQGYRVIIHCYHSEQEANTLANELNETWANSAMVIVADLAVVNDTKALAQFVQTIMQAFGQLDVLVHNASRFYPSPLGSIDQSQWDELFLTNAKAPLLLSQAFYPYLKTQQGCIISLLDIHAHDKPFANYAVYNMAKAAHRMMVHSLALDMAPDVRVNGVAPGVNILPEVDSDQALDSEQQKSIIDSIPMQRIGKPDEIAHSVLYLAQANYVTGEIITVDGGRSLTLAGGS
ncbi:MULTISPECIES: pteridine reductase [unclassified Psychrobacter]|uniref:pteridine reductase n=1 Tax=unclassified Psychrobacter TaxID=196806 RepID=UPI0009A7E24D|nr:MULTISPECIES: pteridine reductase [unclassified Psychrobacter]OXL18511.1 pteridine reductase [Psychrobacter sp. DAB_AL32B]SLJ84383.1 Pteridine reductase [Psychrobacter sp. DAB_AL43B]